MHTQTPFPGIRTGLDLGTLEVSVSAEANDRYWRGAGVDHAARRAGLLYPPMAVNLTILLVQQTERQGFLHTRERLRWHAAAAPCDLVVSGRVAARYVKRGRTYFVVDSEVATAGGVRLWESRAELCTPQASTAGGEGERSDAPPGEIDWGDTLDPVPEGEGGVRSLALTYDLLRTYSRAGNFHSDDEAARDMGLTAMVAMGMQTAGPAFGLALDEWGEEFTATGGLDAKFFGMVGEGETVEVRVAFGDTPAGAVADGEIRNQERSSTTGLVRLLARL